MQSDGLVDRQQFMKSVRPRRADTQPQIDFGEGSDGDRHGSMIVEFQWPIFDD